MGKPSDLGRKVSTPIQDMEMALQAIKSILANNETCECHFVCLESTFVQQYGREQMPYNFYFKWWISEHIGSQPDLES